MVIHQKEPMNIQDMTELIGKARHFPSLAARLGYVSDLKRAIRDLYAFEPPTDEIYRESTRQVGGCDIGITCTNMARDPLKLYVGQEQDKVRGVPLVEGTAYYLGIKRNPDGTSTFVWWAGGEHLKEMTSMPPGCRPSLKLTAVLTYNPGRNRIIVAELSQQ